MSVASGMAVQREAGWLRRWLLVFAALVAAMVVIGGLTRLTESGLSMVEWQPQTVMPPVSEAEWEVQFASYRRTPEFIRVNGPRGMGLEEFKRIFWLEFIHRTWARLLGVAFVIPLFVLLWTTTIACSRLPQFFGLFALGGAQAVVGWLMVASGLVDVPWVSAWRLTLHLLLGFALFAWVLWLASSLRPNATPLPPDVARSVRAVLVVVLLVVGWGGFVAGTRAGLIFNTFPLMNGHWIPPGLTHPDLPLWRNPFENATAVQFIHRMLAFVATGLALTAWFRHRQRVDVRTRRLLGALALSTVVQVSLGAATVMMRVPISFAALHQANALVVVGVAVWLLAPGRGEGTGGEEGSPGARRP